MKHKAQLEARDQRDRLDEDQPGDPAELREAVARLQAKRDKIRALLETIPISINQAIIDDDDDRADALQRQDEIARRQLIRADAALEILDRRLFDAEEVERDRILAEEIGHQVACFDEIVPALEVILAASTRAVEHFREAEKRLGGAVAAARLPRVACTRVDREWFDHWRGSKEEEIGRRPRVEPVRPPTVPVRVRHAWKAYQPGDVVGLAPTEAAYGVDQGICEYVSAAEALPPSPRQAQPPAPDADGRVQVVFVAAPNGERVEPFEDPGAYQAGEVASLKLAQAVRLVRQGCAEFLPAQEGGAGEDDPAEAVS